LSTFPKDALGIPRAASYTKLSFNNDESRRICRPKMLSLEETIRG
jgi:hypothetical protein